MKNTIKKLFAGLFVLIFGATASAAYFTDDRGRLVFGDMKIGDGGVTDYAEIKDDGEINLHGDARAHKTTTVNFDHSVIIGQGKPTLVNRGIHQGFSLPVYNSDNEELFSCKSSALDWDNTADMTMYIGVYLDTANTDKKFKLQLSWDCVDLASSEVVSTNSTDVEVETSTGTASQYTGFKVPFTIATVSDGCSNGNKLAFRVRRIAASVDEAAGEIVVCGMAMKYTIDKFGTGYM